MNDKEDLDERRGPAEGGDLENDAVFASDDEEDDEGRAGLKPVMVMAMTFIPRGSRIAGAGEPDGWIEQEDGELYLHLKYLITWED